MKRVLLSLLLALSLAMPVFAQDGLINPDQIANTIPTTIQVGQDMNAGDLCKIINSGGFKAYKYISRFISSPTYMITGGTNNSYISATRMTDTTAIIAFYDGGDSNKGKAVVATISGGTISMSTTTYLLTGGTTNTYISATRMTDTTAIIAFRDEGDSNKGKAVVATISGGTISMSTPTYLLTGGTDNTYISATRMTDTTAIIAFRDVGDSKGKAVVATISDGTISMSTPTYMITGGTNNSYISATRMTDTTAIIAFRDVGDSKGKAVVATISDGTISMSTPTYMITGGTDNIYISATRMTDTTATIAFQDSGDSNKGKAVVATISGGTISMSTTTYLLTGGTTNTYISATRMTDTTATIAFQDEGDSNKGKAVVATISGGTISMSTPTYMISGGTTNYYISATRMTDTTAIIAFRDEGDSNKGKAVVADIPPIYTYMLPAISNNTVTAGSAGTFSILKPYTKITNIGFSFTGAQPYFIDATTSAWTTTPTNYYVGYALDTTSIMIDGAYYTNTVGGTVGNSTLPVSLIRK
jgi:uncharacterized membrane-anchored protein